MKLLVFLGLAWASYAFAYSPANFDSLLKNYVSELGWVDYKTWSANETDKTKLQSFIDEMAGYDPSRLSGAEELAFWINAYNAFALHEVLNRYPVDTIRPAFLGIPERSFFTEVKHVVMGRSYSLDQIENDVIRKLGEPRIHFALNCASISCPKLLNESFKANRLDEQLNELAVAFVNDPSRNKFDKTNNSAQLSKIFDWFKSDFDDVGGVANYLVQFAQGDALEVLQASETTISYLNYDWGLNKQ